MDRRGIERRRSAGGCRRCTARPPPKPEQRKPSAVAVPLPQLLPPPCAEDGKPVGSEAPRGGPPRPPVWADGGVHDEGRRAAAAVAPRRRRWRRAFSGRRWGKAYAVLAEAARGATLNERADGALLLRDPRPAAPEHPVCSEPLPGWLPNPGGDAPAKEFVP
ncbi:hypothetical protein DIPPA_08461 [Diplonema papillatum]|nr:hypothetical protein DIPPA_08461 [Diplonema papillatum]